MLAARAGSGLSVRAFATREGLSAKRLHWWRSRLGLKAGADTQRAEPSHRRRRAKQPAPRFVPVLMKKSSASALAKAPIVIRHGATTMEIDVSAEVSPAWVAAVMVALELAACS